MKTKFDQFMDKIKEKKWPFVIESFKRYHTFTKMNHEKMKNFGEKMKNDLREEYKNMPLALKAFDDIEKDE